ncbi:hypothetical protein KR100_00245 [Synechococcus sp. KORDI-100]|uniref:AAA family ATPase n=1 Tax=Synechococcus sp. KORDI-100 TaxID=1280380 RepID=UPI0004E098FF|nr:AAA family ATPase [Synechococcus sp. KORDI-100]AII41839.1 hypothetical protein KR100_00245 [Synechococcus sp. KORDI-100]
MKRFKSKGSALGGARSSSTAELRQHQHDATLLEHIQQQTLQEAADAFTREATQPPVTLTEAQQSILDQVMVDVASTDVHTVGIWGFAGVGKTFLTAKITQLLQETYGPDAVRMCGTTHKASRQVERAMASHGVVTEVATVHRLLGVRQVRDEDSGEEYFAPDKNNPPALDAGVQVVICDETSMLEQRLYELLMDALCPRQTVIFVGDSEQIPPVSDGRLCGAFPEECR